jgi:transcriptional regulator with XRE-family HTH domain
MATESKKESGRGRGILVPGLHRARIDAGYSMRRLEADSGVARSTIYRLELGERGAQRRTLQTLAGALGVPLRALTRDLSEPSAEPVPNVGVVASKEDFEFAKMLAAAEGISEDEALGRMVRERTLPGGEQRPLKPPRRSHEVRPKIPAGGLTAAAAVSADRG